MRIEDEYSSIARMAADAIEKATQDPRQHWAIALRKTADTQPTRMKIVLHAQLRSASEAFYDFDRGLWKRISELCSLLDGMPSM